ncbi:Tomoregulin-2 [Varanus komodoensis]|nr:Tomoregulin-2 [Varanus komodoensis]
MEGQAVPLPACSVASLPDKQADEHHAEEEEEEEVQLAKMVVRKAKNANKLEESARGIYIPCPEHFNGLCMHGKCEQSANMLEPSCRCDAGYTGQHCEKKDYSVLYVVPGPVRFQYVLIAAVIGTIQIAIICVVVLCITRLVAVAVVVELPEFIPGKAEASSLVWIWRSLQNKVFATQKY